MLSLNDERGDRCTVAPLQIVPAPPLAIGLVEEEGVVAHHAAIDGAHAGLLDLLGEEIEDGHCFRFGCAASLLRSGCRFRCRLAETAVPTLGLGVGILARADRGIADAEQNNVAMQRAARIHVAVGDDESGPGERVDGQQRKGRRGGGELGVGSGRKQSAVVEPESGWPSSVVTLMPNSRG